MGLRARLATFFAVITVLPLTITVGVLQLRTTSLLDEVRDSALTADREALVLAVEAQLARAGDLAADVARDAGPALGRRNAGAGERLVEEALADEADRADVVVLATPDGRALAARVREPRLAAGTRFQPPDADAIAAAAQRREPVAGLLQVVREVRGGRGGADRRLGWVVAGSWTDERLLAATPLSGGAAALVDDAVVAVVGSDPAAVPVAALPPSGDNADLQLDGRTVTVTSVQPQAGAAGATRLVVWTPALAGSGVLGPTLAILLPAVVLAGVIGWLLASTVVLPIGRAADVARAVAGGDLKQTLEPSGARELADLARALNLMSATLDARLGELERSRDELRRSLSRMGQTLSSSLDLNRTLAAVVETAIDTLAADRGLLRLFTAERDALYVKVGRGVGRDLPRLPAGVGLAGHIARTGSALRLPADAEQAPAPDPGEPQAPHVLAVPMVGRGRVMGVLQLLRDDPQEPFSQDDLDTLRSFAAQASVAVENVILHHEAQRLSVTDPLTGLWNFRYFQLQADRELESAARFERPLSLLIVDIDHFKDVNDRYGHQVGDDVLVEVGRRIQAATRVPDVVARYGGEEFVILLPGTDFDGAMATAERIRHAVGGQPVTVTAVGDVAPVNVSSSLGVATHPRHGETVAALLRSADAAMYTAKTRGRDRVVGAAGDDEARVGERP